MLDTLAEINERHEAVKELEKSLMELHQVFLDMAVLVEAQGEMLDNIEQQVSHCLNGKTVTHSCCSFCVQETECQSYCTPLVRFNQLRTTCQHIRRHGVSA